MQDFVQVLGNENDPGAGLAQVEQAIVHRARCCDVETAGRLRYDEHDRLSHYFAANEDLLLVSARKRAHRGSGAWRSHIVIADKSLGTLARKPPAYPHSFR